MTTITDKAMNAKAGTDDQWLIESGPRGHGRFMGRIARSGERMFYFRYTEANSKRITLPLGAYDPEGKQGLTLKEARAQAGQYSRLYQSGITDIKGHLEQEQRRQEMLRHTQEAREKAEQAAAEAAAAREAAKLNVSGLFERWAEVDLGRPKDSGKSVRRAFDKDVLPLIGGMRVEDVKKGHVTMVTDAILVRGTPRMAKVVFALMRQMFRFAVDRDIIEADPTASLRKIKIGGRDTERDRVLTEEEIRLLVQQLPAAKLIKSTEHALWLCLATGCRIGELLKARWEHLDLERRTWIIPAEHSKNGKPHAVYLSEFALLHFLEARAINGTSPFCFPNSVETGHVCPKTVTKQIGDRQRNERMSGRSKATNTLCLPGGHWTPHDLRRTCATMMVALGVIPEVADRCLSHTEQRKVLRTYIHHSYEKEQKDAWSLVGRQLVLLTRPPIIIDAVICRHENGAFVQAADAPSNASAKEARLRRSLAASHRRAQTV